jgi:hypothetical protein
MTTPTPPPLPQGQNPPAQAQPAAAQAPAPPAHRAGNPPLPVGALPNHPRGQNQGNPANQAQHPIMPPTPSGRPLWQIIVMIAGGILLFLFILGLAVRFIFWLDAKQKESPKDKTRTVEIPLITIENAPAHIITGELWRFHSGAWQGPSKVREVRSLQENDFDVTFKDAYGHDWVWRKRGNEAYWTLGDDKGDIIMLTKTGSRANWSGHMTDKEQSSEPIFFKMEFKIDEDKVITR